jgi:predicted MPP superfamily phosphohydrolase
MASYILGYLIAGHLNQGVRIMIALNLLCLLAIVGTAHLVRLVAQGQSTPRNRTVNAVLLAAFLLLSLGDWALLWSLPRLRLSFSEQIAVPGLASLLVRLLSLWSLLAARLLYTWRQRSRTPSRPAKRTPILFLALNLLFTLVQIDAYVVEPLLIETTELSLRFGDLDADKPPVRVVHITDTHIERYSYREADLVRRVNALQPDIIVLTGDYLNRSYLQDATSAADWRALVSQLQAPYGIYATRGTVEPTPAYMQSLIEGTEITWLEQETARVNVRGQEITLIGVACSHNRETDRARLRETLTGIPPGAFTLLLFHSPDLIAEAAHAGIDLYLGGHTHGGQLRLPLIGPIVTGSIYGRQYVNGLFERRQTTMYISRGLGFEGGAMPRARFLCRPELVSIDLLGS